MLDNAAKAIGRSLQGTRAVQKKNSVIGRRCLNAASRSGWVLLQSAMAMENGLRHRLKPSTRRRCSSPFRGDDAYAAGRQRAVKGPRSACIPGASGNQRRKPLAGARRLVPVRQQPEPPVRQPVTAGDNGVPLGANFERVPDQGRLSWFSAPTMKLSATQALPWLSNISLPPPL